MTQDPKFKNLKPGDKVYLVKRLTREAIRMGLMPFRDYFEVTKVGKKFGYIQDGWMEKPFNLSNGKSHHTDYNAEANGYGFELYFSKEEYEQIIADAKDYAYLKKRLLGDSYYLVKLSPAKVKAIHAILDQKEEQ